MNVDWSFHFEEQFQRIIATIVQAQSYEDGIEWHERIGGQPKAAVRPRTLLSMS